MFVRRSGTAKEARPRGPASRNPDIMTQRPVNLLKLLTIIAVSILVGTEVVGASWAAGWAIGGIMQLPHVVSRGLGVIFGLIGFVLLFFFMRVALRHEPIRD